MKSGRGARWKRLVRALLVFAVALELVYVIAANTILRTRLLRGWVSSDTLTLKYDSAWTLVPAIVYAKNLTLRDRSDDVEWFLRFDQVTTHISLPALLQKRFHCTSVRVDGFSMQQRFRLRPEEAKPVVVAALPDIPGFANPPMRSAATPPTDDGEHPWTIDLEDVDVMHSKEVWIHSMRYAGDVHAHGHFAIVVGRTVDLEHAHADIQSLAASYGNAVIGTNIHGVGDVTIDHATVAGNGAAILRALSVRATLDGDVHTGLGLSSLINVKGVSLIDGVGPAHVDGRIENGSVVIGSRITAEPRDAAIEVNDVRTTEALHLSVAVERGTDGAPIAKASLSASDAHVTNDRAEASIALATLGVEGDRVDLADLPMIDARFSLSLEGVTTNDVARWTAQDDVHTKGVHIDAHATYAYATDDGSAGAEIAVSSLDGRNGDLTALADAASARLVVSKMSLKKGFAGSFAGSTATVRNAVLRISKPRDVALAHASLITFELPSLDAKPHRDLVGNVIVRAPRIELADSAVWSRLLALPDGATLVRGVPVASVDGDFDLATRTARGVIDVRTPEAVVKVDHRTMTGDLHLNVIARRDGNVTDLATSTLAFVEHGGDEALGQWWLTLALARAELQLDPSASFKAHCTGRARDATPAGPFMAAVIALPNVLNGAFGSEGVNAKGDIIIAPGTVILHRIDARDGAAFMRGAYAKDKRGKVGGMLIGVGPAEAAVDLDGNVVPTPPGLAEAYYAKEEAAVAARSR